LFDLKDHLAYELKESTPTALYYLGTPPVAVTSCRMSLTHVVRNSGRVP
jgi:hypothetical protein